jgi:hypothetical protein
MWIALPTHRDPGKSPAMRNIIVGIALLAGACGGGEGEAIVDTPLSGTVGGQAWTFVAGDTDAFLSEGESEFFASLYAATFTPCGFDTPTGDFLIVSVPKEVGEYDFSLSLNMTFAVGSDNLVATDGRIIVDEVTATTVRGGLVGDFDGDNHVNGQFELTICTQ